MGLAGIGLVLLASQPVVMWRPAPDWPHAIRFLPGTDGQSDRIEIREAGEDATTPATASGSDHPLEFGFYHRTRWWPLGRRWWVVQTRTTTCRLDSLGVSAPSQAMWNRVELAMGLDAQPPGIRYPTKGDPDYLTTLWEQRSLSIHWLHAALAGSTLASFLIGLGVVGGMALPSAQERRVDRLARGECPGCRFPRPAGTGRCPECGDGWAEEEVPLQAVGRRR